MKWTRVQAKLIYCNWIIDKTDQKGIKCIGMINVFFCGCTWLKSEENEEARRLLFNPEEPRIRIFRAREESQKNLNLRGARKKNKIKDCKIMQNYMLAAKLFWI